MPPAATHNFDIKPAFKLLRELRETQTALDSSDQPCKFRDSFPETCGRILYEVVSLIKPTLILEIGFEHGSSTLYMLQALADLGAGRLLTIDPDELGDVTRGVGLKNVERAGLEEYHQFLPARSEDLLPELKRRGVRFDMIFIDSNHMFDQTMVEFFFSDKLLRVGGLLALDDYDLLSVRSACNFLETNLNYRALPSNSGRVRIYTKTAYDTREWYYFVPFEVPSGNQMAQFESQQAPKAGQSLPASSTKPAMKSMSTEDFWEDASAPLHFCTSLSHHSLPKLLTLYWSLLRQCRRPFVFWVLCDGEEVHRLLSALDLPNARLVRLSEFEEGDLPLFAVKPERDAFEYNCTIRPSWVLYLLRKYPEIGFLTYMDTDLYFFSDPQPVYHQLRNHSIILSGHRYSSNYRELGLTPEKTGIYNAGWQAFKNDHRAVEALTWWRERCLEWCRRFPENGKFGEQKYLDDWVSRFPGTVALDLIGANVAPWNISDYQLSVDQIGQVLINGQPLIFYHFHALQLEGESSFKVIHEVGAKVKQLTNPNYTVTREQVELIYKPYIRELQQAIALVKSLKEAESGKSDKAQPPLPVLPKISVVTPSYQQALFIEQTIQSVLAQNYPNFEHIVIDGGSTDGTVEILKRYSHLKWISEKDDGQGDALNKGLRQATGEIIAWINSDDWYEPGAFKAVADFFLTNPDKNVVMGDCNLVDGDHNVFDRVINVERGFQELQQFWVGRSIPTQPAIFFRRKLLEEFGYVDPSLRYAMDYDLWLRFAQKNRFYHLDMAVANYRFHAAAKIGDQDWAKTYPECQRVRERYVQQHSRAPKVSVIIACHNYAHYLPEAIESVLRQTFRDYEIIIVDDGSTDNVQVLAEDLAHHNQQVSIKVFSVPDQGPSVARNYGAQQAIGEYLLPLDPDDRITQDYLEKTVPLLEADPQLGFIYVDTVYFGDQELRYQQPEYDFKRLCQGNFISYCSLIRRAAFEDVGGYDKENWGYCEDWDLWIRLGEKGWSGRHLAAPLFYYRDHADTSLSFYFKRLEHIYKAFLMTRHRALYSPEAYAAATRLVDEMPEGWHRRPPLKTVHDAEKFAQRLPNNRHVLYYLGMAYLREHKPMEAMTTFERLLRSFPDDADAREGLRLSRSHPGATSSPPLAPNARPLVSVIVPTFNRPEMLARALKSIYAQTYREFEVIVVNDAGAGVEELITEIDVEGRITYVKHSVNRGLPAARNTGIRLATGKYIAYLDDDDRFLPDHLETLVTFLEAHEAEYKVAYTDAWRVHQVQEGGQYLDKARDVPYSWDFNADALLVGNGFPVLCMMHQKACLENAGLFDETLVAQEDWDLWIRISRTYRFAHIKKTTAEFTWRADATSMTSRTPERFAQTTETIHRKYQHYVNGNPALLEAQRQYLRRQRSGDAGETRAKDTYECSIVIPVFNKVELTRQCLTALAQTTHGVDYQVIVVDNGSSDDTPALLTTLGGDVRVIRNEENLGFARACNQGASAAKGDYLVFLNNDTIPQAGWLQALVEEVKRHPEVAVVGSKLLYPDGRVQHAGVVFSRVYYLPYHAYPGFPGDAPVVNRRRECQAVSGDCMLVRRDTFQAVGGFDEGYRNGFEDVDLCLKVRQEGGRVVYQPESVLYHLAEQSSQRKEHDEENGQRLHERWGGRWLEDEDALYVPNGYVARAHRADGRVSHRLEPLSEGMERARWERVAGVQRLGQAGDLAAVRSLLAQADAWPEDTSVLRWAANICRRAEVPASAEAFWRRLLTLEEAPEARAALARLALERGRLEEARGHLDILLAREPTHGEGWLLQGVWALQQQRYAEAVKAFEAVIQHGGDVRRARKGLGMAALWQGQAQRAWELFTTVLAEEPDDAEAIHWLLRAGTALERWQPLADQLWSFLRINPGDLAVRFALAGVYIRMAKWEAARQESETLRLLQPTFEGLDELAQAIEKGEQASAPNTVDAPYTTLSWGNAPE